MWEDHHAGDWPLPLALLNLHDHEPCQWPPRGIVQHVACSTISMLTIIVDQIATPSRVLTKHTTGRRESLPCSQIRNEFVFLEASSFIWFSSLVPVANAGLSDTDETPIVLNYCVIVRLQQSQYRKDFSYAVPEERVLFSLIGVELALIRIPESEIYSSCETSSVEKD